MSMNETPTYVPDALYQCGNELCAEEGYPHPAEELFWYANESRWLCQWCYKRLGVEPTKRGVSLEGHLRRTPDNQ